MAERVGFEPTVPLRGRPLSRRVHSATLAPLRLDEFSTAVCWPFDGESARKRLQLTVGSTLFQSVSVERSWFLGLSLSGLPFRESSQPEPRAFSTIGCPWRCANSFGGRCPSELLWAMVIVIHPPGFDNGLCLGERGNRRHGQALITALPGTRFNTGMFQWTKSILQRLVGLTRTRAGPRCRAICFRRRTQMEYRSACGRESHRTRLRFTDQSSWRNNTQVRR